MGSVTKIWQLKAIKFSKFLKLTYIYLPKRWENTGKDATI